jgi:hypothetical protein
MSKKITNSETLEALEKSITERWEPWVAHLAELPAGGEFRSCGLPNTSSCALCEVYDGDCEGCVLGKVDRDCNSWRSLYQNFCGAITNGEAYVAATAMLCKLRELRDEWAAKVEEERAAEKAEPKHRFKVGDRVEIADNSAYFQDHRPMDRGTVESITSKGRGPITVNIDGNITLSFMPHELAPLAPEIDVGDLVEVLNRGSSKREQGTTMAYVEKVESPELLWVKSVEYTGDISTSCEPRLAAGYIHAKPTEARDAIKFLRWCKANRPEVVEAWEGDDG